MVREDLRSERRGVSQADIGGTEESFRERKQLEQRAWGRDVEA